MAHYLIEQGYIPFDKSWIIRMGTLDLFNGYAQDSIDFLKNQKKLSDDLLSLQRALYDWRNLTVYVGESATLYRILQFNSWQNKLDKVFVKEGTLKRREICNDPSIVNYSQQKLLKIDNGTTQWATAKVISGDEERILNPPPKLQLTYDAVEHWRKQRQESMMWESRYDEIILLQAETYLELLQGKRPKFIPRHSEDYCFARAFDYITKEEGDRHWPQLHKQETDRIVEMENALNVASKLRIINSPDHRVVQAVAMSLRVKNIAFGVTRPEAVNKSWPQCWDFLERYR